MQQEMKRVTKRDQLCVVVRHVDFKADDEHIELHAVKRYFQVTEEGDPDLFFMTWVQVLEVRRMQLQFPSQKLLMMQSMGHWKK